MSPTTTDFYSRVAALEGDTRLSDDYTALFASRVPSPCSAAAVEAIEAAHRRRCSDGLPAAQLRLDVKG